jgi:DNA replication protein DnaC
MRMTTWRKGWDGCCEQGVTLRSLRPITRRQDNHGLRPYIRFRPRLCDACAEKQAEERQKESSRWERLCPALYRNTDLCRVSEELYAKSYHERWTQEVLGWEYGQVGLVVSGPTGTGKSRLVWVLLRRLLDDENHTGLALDGMTFRSALKLARNHGIEEYLRRLVRCAVLYWDDLGGMHLTANEGEVLLHVVEQRCAGQKPILAITQCAGPELETRLSQSGSAIRRRLNEFCRVVRVARAEEQHQNPGLSSANGKAVG